jgi:hypothetical protein
VRELLEMVLGERFGRFILLIKMFCKLLTMHTILTDCVLVLPISKESSSMELDPDN